MRFSFQRFQTRLLVFLLLPLLLALAAVYIAVDRANRSNALELITQDLAIGVANFNASIADRNENLAIAGDALTSDFAFRQAWSTDHATLLSAMDNLLGRLVTADFIAMVDTDARLLIADTRRPALTGVTPEWLALIEQAEALDRQGEYPEASDVVVLDGRPYHLTVLPFLTPNLEGWIALGFEIGEAFTTGFKQSISAEVSVLYQDAAGRWQLSGSTLPAELRENLVAAFNSTGGNATPLLNLAGADYVTLASSISNDNTTVQVVLQRSLAAQLKPYDALRQRLLTIFGIGLVAVMGSMMLVSRNVTQPLQLLTAGARRITAGDYQQKVAIPHKDEVGELAAAFNAMATGLAEKERMRDLLGKVVSPAIANELMSRRPELGGEEREVTLLFTDIRGFTTLCEGRSPQEILALLNEYFTALSAVIEQHGGVVDKYIGDAVMALYGAPVPSIDAPVRAIRTALAIAPALATLNQSLVQRGLQPISMGLGINTDHVVVGNMGSQSRLNYTAIGDGVNLASRLEALTKRYGVAVIVSESTRLLAPDFLYLELDLVRVKGKQEPVRIYEPLCALTEATSLQLQLVARFTVFLQLWQAGFFVKAADAFADFVAIAKDVPVLMNGIVPLYQQRVTLFINNPPAQWDGVVTFDEK